MQKVNNGQGNISNIITLANNLSNKDLGILINKLKELQNYKDPNNMDTISV